MKLLFIPVSVLAGLVAGLLGKKAFEGVWKVIDEEEPPSPEHRELAMPKLVLALLLEGAIFRLVKGLTDHGARRVFSRATGSWPGEERPEQVRA
jgi:hypothetical protein